MLNPWLIQENVGGCLQCNIAATALIYKKVMRVIVNDCVCRCFHFTGKAEEDLKHIESIHLLYQVRCEKKVHVTIITSVFH